MFLRIARTVAVGLAVLILVGCGPPANDTPVPTPSESYVPQPLFCADRSGSLCGVMPSMIGADPPIATREGYPGLTHDVPSFVEDSQTSFDNMSWQMFMALDQEAAGEYSWQDYTRVEQVFGGPRRHRPAPTRATSPVFSLTTKSDGQPSPRPRVPAGRNG